MGPKGNPTYLEGFLFLKHPRGGDSFDGPQAVRRSFSRISGADRTGGLKMFFLGWEKLLGKFAMGMCSVSFFARGVWLLRSHSGGQPRRFGGDCSRKKIAARARRYDFLREADVNRSWGMSGAEPLIVLEGL